MGSWALGKHGQDVAFHVGMALSFEFVDVRKSKRRTKTVTLS